MKRFLTIIFLSYSFVSISFAEEVNPDSVKVAGLEEVVVTGSNSVMALNKLPYTVSVVDARQLEGASSNQLLTVLSGRIPSLFVTEKSMLGFTVGSNGGSGHIKIRGVGGDKASAVLMMVDGQPQYAGIFSHHIADFYGKENVERVEVLRGPASVLYGSNAMAGAINIITKSVRRDGFYGSLRSSYGSYNTSQTTASASYGKNAFSVMANAAYDHTDGNIKGMDFSQWSGYMKCGYRFSSNWSMYADATLTRFSGDDPVYATLSDPDSEDVYSQKVIRGEGSVSVSNRYLNTSGNAKVYYSWGNHFIDDPRHFHSTDGRLGVLIYQNFSLWHNAEATAGFDFDSYSGRIPVSGGKDYQQAPMATMTRKTVMEYSPYMTVSQRLWQDCIMLSAGLRMANSSKFATQWVPQIGFSVSPQGLFTFKGSVGKGYRNPSFRELYLYKMANDELQPESMWNYELTLSKSISSRISLSLTAYLCKGGNMIQVVDMHNENTGSFINKGIEFSLVSHPVKGLWINGSYSVLKTTLHDLTGAPRQQYFLSADWMPHRRWRWTAICKGVTGLYVSENKPRESFATLDLKVDFAAIPKWLDVFAQIDNVTNTSYEICRGYKMPGINFTLGFEFKF